MSGLSRGIKTFLAVDAVLVLVLVVAAVIVLSGGGDDGDRTAGDRTPAATAGATGSAGSSPGAADESSPDATADPAVASADVTVLDYGRTEQVGPYTCISATNGVTCVVEDSGTGFRVATAELVTLP
jgi:hypothetical protein